MTPRQKTRIVNCMRNLMANGWDDEALIVDTAAQVIGGGDKAIENAQRVYDQTFKIFNAN